MNTCLRFPGGRDRALTLSYDDGVATDIRLAEILDANGIRATFNINTGMFGPEDAPPVEDPAKDTRRLTVAEAVALYKNSPHEVAVHALTHPFLEQMTAALVTYEVMEDRKKIEELFGTVCRGMAYPYGTSNATVVEALQTCGIAYSRTTVATERFDLPQNWLLWPSTCHHNNPRLFELCDSFLADIHGGRPPRLFYLWGHSYEFARNDNWEIIENFPKKMGNDSRIWYATNIEIHDYVENFRRLEYSANGRRIHNPTATDLYFATTAYSPETVCIPAGQTVEI